MPGITDLFAKMSELTEITKNIAPSQTSGQTAPTQFVFANPALTVSRFSLPSRCTWATIVCTSAINVAFNSAVSFNFIPMAANTPLVLSGNGPLDLSTFSVHCIAASSGVTVTAWVQQAAALAT